MKDSPISTAGGLAGYAAIIGNALLPLNGLDDFKSRYARVSCRFLLDSPHWSYAALIAIDRGTLSVGGVGKDLPGFTEAVKSSDGYVRMSTYDYLAFAGRRMGIAALSIKWLTGRITLLRPLHLIRLFRIYRLLVRNAKRNPPVDRNG